MFDMLPFSNDELRIDYLYSFELIDWPSANRANSNNGTYIMTVDRYKMTLNIAHQDPISLMRPRGSCLNRRIMHCLPVDSFSPSLQYIIMSSNAIVMIFFIVVIIIATLNVLCFCFSKQMLYLLFFLFLRLQQEEESSEPEGQATRLQSSLCSAGEKTHVHSLLHLPAPRVLCSVCCLNSIISLTPVQYTVGGGDLSTIIFLHSTYSPLWVCAFFFELNVDARFFNATLKRKVNFGRPWHSVFV